MDALGQLTGGVAHDFNNLLTTILGNIDVLMHNDRQLGHAENIRLLRLVQHAAEQGEGLANRLLAFARQEPIEPQVADANELVAGMSDLLRQVTGKTISVEIVPAANLWPVRVDHSQLESALLNLAANARDAMEHGGKLIVETSNVHRNEKPVGAHRDAKSGPYVVVAVRDTGTGMTEETMARAFEPFFTTKPKGKGTGLGLSQVYGFAKQSGGYVELHSASGRGTTVTIYLPRAFAAGAPPASTNGATSSASA